MPSYVLYPLLSIPVWLFLLAYSLAYTAKEPGEEHEGGDEAETGAVDYAARFTDPPVCRHAGRSHRRERPRLPVRRGDM